MFHAMKIIFVCDFLTLDGCASLLVVGVCACGFCDAFSLVFVIASECYRINM